MDGEATRKGEHSEGLSSCLSDSLRVRSSGCISARLCAGSRIAVFMQRGRCGLCDGRGRSFLSAAKMRSNKGMVKAESN